MWPSHDCPSRGVSFDHERNPSNMKYIVWGLLSLCILQAVSAFLGKSSVPAFGKLFVSDINTLRAI